MFHIRKGLPVPPKKSAEQRLGYGNTADAMEVGDCVLFEAKDPHGWKLARKRGLVMYTQIVRKGYNSVTRTVPEGIMVWKLKPKAARPIMGDERITD